MQLVMKMLESWILIIFTIILLSSPLYVTSIIYPTANLSTSWINSVSANDSRSYRDGSLLRYILRATPNYACGFYCNGNCETYLFAIFIDTYYDLILGFPPPQVVWSGNPNIPVGSNATLELTSEGDLVLRDADGSLAWSTNTSGMSVAGLNLTELGNLVLFDSRNSVVWQSFDHPTDTLVSGQILVSGKNLTSSASQTNFSQTGLYTLSMTSKGLVAYVGTDPPQAYFNYTFDGDKVNQEPSYAKFQNGSLQLYINTSDPNEPDLWTPVPVATSAQYVKIGPDGHLRVIGGNNGVEVADLLTDSLGNCGYPTVCGKYGICSNNGQCSCPGLNSGVEYFRQINERQPNLGCSEVVPIINCGAPNSNHSFLDLENMTYSTFHADITGIDMNRCKETCLKNCSCKAAVIRYSINSSNGDCYLPSEVFSMMNIERDQTDYSASVSIKVQMPLSVTSHRNPEDRNRVLGSILGPVAGILVVVVGLAVFMYRKKKKNARDAEEDILYHVPGMPTKFSYEELVLATGNFSRKLGQGGFGSVFEGSLKDSTQIAVKCLDGIGHVKKSFLAEIETIGSIHHVNLVRLIGFCAEKSHRLLVYEYMCNGSLDKWIYHRNGLEGLDWNRRRRIILDIAKGLAYLHEECRKKIIHLDIKPQNILLDENYNAKLGDFGLSKLMEKNQSKVFMTMRGTPGYLAPEWTSATITEKVDVYSFGIVVLEILCGRKNFEESAPEEERHLLALFKKKAGEGQWLDLIDRGSDDMQSNGAEVVGVIKSAGWCLQSNSARRPLMSTVVKVIEGGGDIQTDLDFDLLIPEDLVNNGVQETGLEDGTLVLPSVLSGPR